MASSDLGRGRGKKSPSAGPWQGAALYGLALPLLAKEPEPEELTLSWATATQHPLVLPAASPSGQDFPLVSNMENPLGPFSLLGQWAARDSWGQGL